MSITVGHPIGRRTPTWLTHGFQPFFLAAGLWAATALALI